MEQTKWKICDQAYGMSVCVCVCVCVLSCHILCHPMDCSPAGSTVHGIFQERILEWVPFSPPRGLPNPGIELESLMHPALASKFFTTVPPGKPRVCSIISHSWPQRTTMKMHSVQDLSQRLGELSGY